MSRRAVVALLFAALCACAPSLAPPARGEVFLRGGGTAPEAGLRGAGGRVVLSREATVNGARGALRVWSVPAAVAGEAARGLFGADADPGAARFAALGDGRSWAVWSPGEGECAAMVFERESGSPSDGAPVWPFSDIPAPTSLAPGFSATASGGGASPAAVCTGRVAVSPAAAMSALGAALEAGGWTPVTPGGDRAGACFFGREDSDAVVFASAFVAGDGATGWLVLRRGAE